MDLKIFKEHNCKKKERGRKRKKERRKKTYNFRDNILIISLM